MPQHVDKDLLRQQFQRAAVSYEKQAVVQQQAAERLLELLIQQPQRVLEIGCGSGLLTRRLLAKFNSIEELVLNDLVPDFASRLGLVSPALRFLPGDIETLPLPGSFDLIISSSALHWLHDLNSLLDKLAAHLAPGGWLAFSLYGPENLHEIRELTGIGLKYRSHAELEEALRRRFRLLHSSRQIETLHFSSPQEVLRHLRETGVNSLSRSPWSRAKLEQFCAEYRRRFSADGGVTLTYDSLYFLAQNAD
ncbi:malonyl-ACP O-methyltransferase BioC [Candidatus Electronema sp. JM]|uniref:malonyl-ACP O-methyltransferase BioC n=1 Tax=Candidatus Electronema sp. JM TaxID=3401571 RepID=UPI003AA8CE3E